MTMPYQEQIDAALARLAQEKKFDPTALWVNDLTAEEEAAGLALRAVDEESMEEFANSAIDERNGGPRLIEGKWFVPSRWLRQEHENAYRLAGRQVRRDMIAEGTLVEITLPTQDRPVAQDYLAHEVRRWLVAAEDYLAGKTYKNLAKKGA